MPKKKRTQKTSKLFILLTTTLAITILYAGILVLPSGQAVDILTTKTEGTELLFNPNLHDNSTGWDKGAWRFISESWAPSTWIFREDSVTMSMKAYDQSFHCIGLAQWTDIPIHDLQHQYQVTFKGAINNAKTLSAGALGMGVNLWLEAIQNGEVADTLELYVFFHQKGFYTIPVGAFKDYGYRGSYWFEQISDKKNDTPWRFFYFHPTQLNFNETRELTFSLNNCLETVRNNAGAAYQNAEYFRLFRIDPVMEMIMGEGTFTVEMLSLRRIG